MTFSDSQDLGKLTKITNSVNNREASNFRLFIFVTIGVYLDTEKGSKRDLDIELNKLGSISLLPSQAAVASHPRGYSISLPR